MRKAIPKKIRDQVRNKFDGHCGYCGEKPKSIVIDHIKPVISGGTNDLENLMPACFSCNNYKIMFDIDRFRDELSEQVSRARQRSVNFRLAERFGLIQEIKKPILFHFETGSQPAEKK